MQALQEEVAERQQMSASLESSLEAREEAARSEEQALLEADMGERSKGAVRVALLEGEIDRWGGCCFYCLCS